MLNTRIKQYVETVTDVAVAFAAYYWLGWVGFGLWGFFVVMLALRQAIANQNAITKILLSRLPDRCAFCHREIVDEGGVFDETGIYHAECSDKLASLEELRNEGGVSAKEAIHKPRSIAHNAIGTRGKL